MKKQKRDWTIELIMIILLIAILASCTGSKLTHYYDQDYREYLKNKDNSYRLKVHNDTMFLYYEEKEVGRVISKWNSPLDSLILSDNQ